MYKITNQVKKIFFISVLLSNMAVFAKDNSQNCSPTSGDPHLQQSIKWYRDSAEKKVLYHEIYSLATSYVTNWVATNNPKNKSWGVVIDIDETTLDNSWYFFKCSDVAGAESNFEHYVTIPKKSVALPGVIAFTQKVHSLGGYVTMVSNRDGSYKDSTGDSLSATVANLKQQDIYFDQVVLGNFKNSTKSMDKNLRFQAVISGKYNTKEMVWSNELPPHKVIAYLGDNIQDFPELKQKDAYLNADKPSLDDKFGNGYFLFPNPIYGSWESSHYH